MPKQPTHPKAIEELALEHRTGRRRIVLVEGNTDADVLTYLFQSVTSQIVFEPRRGVESLQQEAEELTRLLSEPSPRVYSIRDRDFLPDGQVLPCYQSDYTGIHFCWQRHELENYLLDAQGWHEKLSEYLRGQLPPELETPEAIQLAIERLGRELIPHTVYNWIVTDLRLPMGQLPPHEAPSADEALAKLINDPYVMSARHGWKELGEENLTRLFVEKQNAIEDGFPQNLHQYVAGRTLWFKVTQAFPTPCRSPYFRNSILAYLRLHLPDDLRRIVMEQILKR